MRELTRENAYGRPIVTAIEPASAFYRAEDYHQDYFTNNPYQPYCRAIIDPKIKKLRKEFQAKLRDASPR